MPAGVKIDMRQADSSSTLIDDVDLSQFMATISHDLKEPLRTIRCYTEMLSLRLAGAEDADIARILKFVVDAAARMQVLVDDAADFALAGSSWTEQSRIELDQALQFALSNLQNVIAQRKAVVTSGTLPSATANFGAVSRVFQNLIANAIKYSRKQPRIQVDCVLRDGELTLSVADNGIGINPEDRESVFQPFKRLHTQQRYSGTGLGLAICRGWWRITAGESGAIRVRAWDRRSTSRCRRRANPLGQAFRRTPLNGAPPEARR
jgi:light-regulated signal transduction histidine kinase (bacteriophytochrome)